MKGQIEVLGTNHGLRAFEGFKGEGSLVSVDKEHHCLMLGDEKLFNQICMNLQSVIIKEKSFSRFRDACLDKIYS